MALISCPECGKEISDKAKMCIHCGYPLDNILTEELFSIEFVGFSRDSDSTRRITNPIDLCSLMQKILGRDWNTVDSGLESAPYTLIDGITMADAEWLQQIAKQYKGITEIKPYSGTENNTKLLEKYRDKSYPTVLCPACASSEVSTGQRGYKLTTGFLGSNKTVNRCAKCGKTWEP